MLGFRGAARYDHPAYAAGFGPEGAALRRVREKMGLTNLRVMVPSGLTRLKAAGIPRDFPASEPGAST